MFFNTRLSLRKVLFHLCIELRRRWIEEIFTRMLNFRSIGFSAESFLSSSISWWILSGAEVFGCTLHTSCDSLIDWQCTPSITKKHSIFLIRTRFLPFYYGGSFEIVIKYNNSEYVPAPQDLLNQKLWPKPNWLQTSAPSCHESYVS